MNSFLLHPPILHATYIIYLFNARHANINWTGSPHLCDSKFDPSTYIVLVTPSSIFFLHFQVVFFYSF